MSTSREIQRGRVALLASFLGGQGALQALQAVNGLACVWLLPIPEFAVYAVFTAALGLTSQLLGFGINPTIVSLVGPEVDNRKKIARYLKAGGQLRTGTLALVTPLGLALLWVSGGKSGFAAGMLGVLSVCLAGANILAARIDLLSAPLQMQRRIGTLYRNQVFGEIVKTAVLAGLWLTQSVNVLTAVLAGLAGLACTHAWLRHAVGRFRTTDPVTAERREILHFILPGIPNALFGAFQGQIALFVSAALGGARQTASVGALGRISRLLAFCNAANPMLLGPSLTRLPEASFQQRLPWVLTGAAGLSLALGLSGFLLPGPLIAILGARYQDLEGVVGLLTAGAGFAYAGSVMATIISFKRWTAWWYSFGVITLVLCAQAVVCWRFPMNSVQGVLALWVAANAVRTVCMAGFIAVARMSPQWLRPAPQDEIAKP